MTKVCSECKAEKETLGGFRKNASQEDGFDYWCKECRSVWEKNWRKANPRSAKETNRRNYVNHREVRLANAKEYYAANPEKIVAKVYAYQQKRLLVDPAYRIRKSLRCRIRSAMLGLNKSGSTATLIGCPWDYLREWLQAKFKPGMTWENYGEWHIDHILPCASFNLIDPIEQRRCFHYTNLQPLWAEENLQKSSKIL